MMMMMRGELCARNFQISGFGNTCSSSSDQSSTLLNNRSFIYYSSRFSMQFITPNKKYNKKCPSISCQNNHSHGKFNPKSYHHQPHDDDDDFLQASLLIPETVKHHNLRKRGFREEVKKFAGQFRPSSAQMKDRRNEVNSIGLNILGRFRHPTIFLKISCEGDFLLPIVVGELAVEKLINSLDEDNLGDCSNQFQFVRNLVVGLGSEVRMVKITERVVNTYFARVYVGKVGERGYFSLDARPSDAINVAQRCKAPIYVHKQIVLTDAIRIAYGTGRVRDTKPVYDVLLDSPIDGPDLLVEEFNLVQKMNLAVKEEKYNDAAMWRDKLVKLHSSKIQASQPNYWREASTPDLP